MVISRPRGIALVSGIALLALTAGCSQGVSPADRALAHVSPPAGTILMQRSGTGPAHLGRVGIAKRADVGVQASCVGSGEITVTTKPLLARVQAS
jgi:hypothetical protein